MSRRVLLALGALASSLGCDSDARPSAASATALPMERLSGEQESCATTAHCQEGLRCFEQVCRGDRSSLEGDYYAAVAERQLAAGDARRAIESYRTAESRYRAEGSEELPAELQCGFGRALAAERMDLLVAEEAASRLHRCLSAAPVGSPLRARALAALAELDDVGLDPAHLAAARTADRYLTRAPTSPPSENLELSVSADRQSRARSFTQFMELAGSAEVRAKLQPCWEDHWRATRQNRLEVKVPVRHTFRVDDYGYFDRAAFEAEEYDPPAEEALREATRCVEQVIVPLGEELARRLANESRWTATLTVILGS